MFVLMVFHFLQRRKAVMLGLGLRPMTTGLGLGLGLEGCGLGLEGHGLGLGLGTHVSLVAGHTAIMMCDSMEQTFAYA